MFDISFAELMMVTIVGLLVIGPEKLPKLARTLGAYTGRLQRYVSQVKEEVNREMRFEQLQALQEEIQAGANQVKSSILDTKKAIEGEPTALEKNVKPKRNASTKKTSTKRSGTTSKKTTSPKKTASKKTSSKKPAAKKTVTKKSNVKPVVRGRSS